MTRREEPHVGSSKCVTRSITLGAVGHMQQAFMVRNPTGTCAYLGARGVGALDQGDAVLAFVRAPCVPAPHSVETTRVSGHDTVLARTRLGTCQYRFGPDALFESQPTWPPCTPSREGVVQRGPFHNRIRKHRFHCQGRELLCGHNLAPRIGLGYHAGAWRLATRESSSSRFCGSPWLRPAENSMVIHLLARPREAQVLGPDRRGGGNTCRIWGGGEGRGG